MTSAERSPSSPEQGMPGTASPARPFGLTLAGETLARGRHPLQGPLAPPPAMQGGVRWARSCRRLGGAGDPSLTHCFPHSARKLNRTVSVFSSLLQVSGGGAGSLSRRMMRLPSGSRCKARERGG